MLKKITNLYDHLEEKLLVASLWVTVLLIFSQIIMRWLFNYSLTWSEELARYLFIWQIWLGTSIGFRDDQHIRIEFVRDKLKGKAVLVYDIIGGLIVLAFSVFLLVKGWQLVDRLFATRNLSAALRLPMGWVYLSLPFSSLVVCLRIIAKMVRDCKEIFNPTLPAGTGSGEIKEGA